jgi:hypothetical protein
MNTFDFGDGITVAIKNVDGEVIVKVTDSDGDNIEISGFPNEKDANSFVMFGDFEDPKDNDFINIANPNYELKWKFD